MSIELPSARSGSNGIACADVVSTRTVCAPAFSAEKPANTTNKIIPQVQIDLRITASFLDLMEASPPDTKDPCGAPRLPRDRAHYIVLIGPKRIFLESQDVTQERQTFRNILWREPWLARRT